MTCHWGEEAYLKRDSSVDSRRKTPVGWFRCWETHPSHWEDHSGLPSFFSSSYTVFSSKGAFIQSEGAASERVFSRLIPSRENSEISLRPIWEEGKAHIFPSSSSYSDEGIISGAFYRHWECNTWGGHIRGSRAIISSDPGKYFRPISQSTWAISLRHTSADSNGEINRAQFSRVEGAHFPQGDPSGDQIH